MSDKDQPRDRPIFPFDPIVVSRSMFHSISSASISTKDDVWHLMSLMYEHPEREFNVYFEDGKGVGRQLVKAEEQGFILITTVTRDFYAHPKSKNDWVRIDKSRARPPLFEWEQQVIERGPMYRQATLKLSAKGQRKVERERHRFMTRFALVGVWSGLVSLALTIVALLIAFMVL